MHELKRQQMIKIDEFKNKIQELNEESDYYK